MPDKSYISKYGMDASKNGVNHLEKTFSGYIEYNDSGYRPLFLYWVKDGKVLQRLDLRKQVKVVSKKKGVGVSSDCEECEPEYEVVCEEIEDPDATNGVGWECTDVFIGLNCYPMPCPGGGGEDPDDCSNPNNADLPECSFEDEEDCEYYGTCDDGGDDEHLTECLDYATNRFVIGLEQANNARDSRSLQCYANNLGIPAADLLQIFPSLFEAIIEARATQGGSLANIDWEGVMNFVNDLLEAKQNILHCIVDAELLFNDEFDSLNTRLQAQWSGCYNTYQ